MSVAHSPPLILVPVYSNAALVARCLESIIAAGLDGARLLIVNDAAEPKLAGWLDDFSREYGAQLLSHEQNLGFVRAVNSGLAQADGEDVVLLNSDTAVPTGWWQRLQAAAYSADRIATVTPLSNNGDICSYPLHAADPPADAASLDALCVTVNADRVVEIPTGVGFCLFIRGACLAEVGHFDAEAFGRGYGEENDFCMRAAAAGWKHLCHTGVYVEHVGGASFGPEREELMARGDRILAERYPDYSERIETFLAADPLAPARDALNLARLDAPEQRGQVLTEFSTERRAARTEYRATLRALRGEVAEFNARCDEYESIVDELREANGALVSQYQTIESSHTELADELGRVRSAFSEADKQLLDTRGELAEAGRRIDELQQHLDFAQRQRDDYAAEVDRLNSLWPLRLARRVKRILRL